MSKIEAVRQAVLQVMAGGEPVKYGEFWAAVHREAHAILRNAAPPCDEDISHRTINAGVQEIRVTHGLKYHGDGYQMDGPKRQED